MIPRPLWRCSEGSRLLTTTSGRPSKSVLMSVARALIIGLPWCRKAIVWPRGRDQAYRNAYPREVGTAGCLWVLSSHLRVLPDRSRDGLEPIPPGILRGAGIIWCRQASTHVTTGQESEIAWSVHCTDPLRANRCPETVQSPGHSSSPT